MNNKDFITTLSRRTGHEIEKTTALCASVVTDITKRLQDNKTVCLPGFGKFDVLKLLEHISENPVTGQKTLEPPCLEVRFEYFNTGGDKPTAPTEDREKIRNNGGGLSDVFVQDFCSLLSEGLQTDNYVNIKGLGTFKKIEGVVSYVPDSILRDTINKPFSHFEAVVLADNVDFSAVKTDEEKSEESSVGAVLAVALDNASDDSKSTQAPVVETCRQVHDQPVQMVAHDGNDKVDATHDENAKGLPWAIISTIFLAGLLIGGFLVWAIMAH